ncbi:hypothetical protein FVEG_04860 [Fusarium verticillioides 7600]|uniref:Uncharacterized protein n=1 Tax=Gibberella moniliformis (strain M3125 / FGSC 7600) TaxID=334819 RepID=W7M705_GIBM7|nr:hypothetical protein FVEG_04860 [Fusarium verticillioides 7600]EWG43345.1 hypothetical protein FVEG_04860 [Fusarium verticillioides 7600]
MPISNPVFFPSPLNKTLSLEGVEGVTRPLCLYLRNCTAMARRAHILARCSRTCSRWQRGTTGPDADKLPPAHHANLLQPKINNPCRKRHKECGERTLNVICQICLVSKQAKTRHDATLQASPTPKTSREARKQLKRKENIAEPLLNTGDTMWSLLENVSEKRVGVENFNSDARDVLQARVNGTEVL